MARARVFWTFLALALATPAAASVEVRLTVEGPRGAFASSDPTRPTSMIASSVQMDFGPSSPAPLAAARPVTITRTVDALSWQFLGAAAAGDLLRVIITVTRSATDSDVQHRRVVTLTNARVLDVHTATDAAPDDGHPGLGVETVTFTYERIDVEDDGVKVYASGA